MGGVSCKKCQEVLEIQGEHRVSGVFEPLALRGEESAALRGGAGSRR